MALTKGDIVLKVATEAGLSKAKASRVVERVLEIMKGSLTSGNDVLICGFGKFCVKEKAERRGRNPATGDDLMLSARRVVTFKCAGNLRKLCNK